MAQREAIIVINAGSSSIKFSIFHEENGTLELFLKGQIDGLYTEASHFSAHDVSGAEIARWSDAHINNATAVQRLLEFVESHLGDYHIEAVGHRIVHGGTTHTTPVRLTAEMLTDLEKLIPLAPLHQSHNLAAVHTLLEHAPDLPQIGCFDTAFHTTQAPLAQAFALPADITQRGVRRYGFHGLSYEYIASALPSVSPSLATAKVIAAHLGNGASLCAMEGGRSVASTMGFTAVEGLPMGTRSGTLDPGVILYLMDEMNMSTRDIETLLYKKSGLLGVSGISSDMRTLEGSDAPSARFAIDLFAYRIAREIGSLAAALGGLDALVFTAGIGEHSANLRRAVMAQCAWLGLTPDEAANAAGGPCISAKNSTLSAWVVPTDEELMIARHCKAVLGLN